MKNKAINMIRLSFIALMPMYAFALGEQLTGTETGHDSSKTSACASAKNRASRTAQNQISFLETTGQLREKKYKIFINGCNCDETSYAGTRSATCSTDWSINIEKEK